MAKRQRIPNKRLTELRVKANMTQGHLAEKVKLTQSMISYIESGRKEPNSITKMLLATYFGVSVEWLFYEQLNDAESLMRLKRINGDEHAATLDRTGTG